MSESNPSVQNRCTVGYFLCTAVLSPLGYSLLLNIVMSDFENKDSVKTSTAAALEGVELLESNAKFHKEILAFKVHELLTECK